MTVTASFLVGQHVHERTVPRVERALLESAGVGSFRRVHVCVCACDMRGTHGSERQPWS